MIPETLTPERFHLAATAKESGEADKNANQTQNKRTLAGYENDILATVAHNGQSRNMLLEERDRHIKERLFRVIKIEAFARAMNDLQAQGVLDAQELSQIISEKTEFINEAGNKIWLNLITREKTTPIFYHIADE
ncbi:MAG: hypothetical protein LBU96_06830 [Yokenella regensburgei]|jgi:hypothetical protein|uniref:Cytoplasmic protein n=1 Tax=Yokenella regensburgei TaxID=158877 RepID=A0ABX9RZK6_9ENTR|nr:hypothetical protein [Yokenella regensburgei]EHM49246.1 hypothetical protein HMPREF0880_01810 [Yokenella regensburgei ATCC 43003]MDR2217021.1 hypothetical protein [Yokenella regensburgei]MDR3104150.1 hypothetical protein [Yokenella regensburgei]QIU90440.1 hypothetical protein HEC60_14565 [Yokenella regensburgei]RKR54590.1 hypothetical protein C7387_2754 [Yokenella regensburgei]